jgi:putative transposase
MVTATFLYAGNSSNEDSHEGWRLHPDALRVKFQSVTRGSGNVDIWEHQIRDEEDLARHVDYIHFNPVKHGLVAQVKDWPHSSFHKWVERGDLPAEWGLVKQAGGNFGE